MGTCIYQLLQNVYTLSIVVNSHHSSDIPQLQGKDNTKCTSICRQIKISFHYEKSVCADDSIPALHAVFAAQRRSTCALWDRMP